MATPPDARGVDLQQLGLAVLVFLELDVHQATDAKTLQQAGGMGEQSRRTVKQLGGRGQRLLSDHTGDKPPGIAQAINAELVTRQVLQKHL